MKYISQKGQDKWLIETVFNHKKNGFFVDLAATDGMHINNTYILETHYNWRGICIEPNPNFFPQLAKNRRCITIKECIDQTEHDITFRFDNGALGGIIDKDTDNNMHVRGREIQRAKKSNGTIKMRTKTLETVLDENNAPLVIEFLSLDVEGSETRIMRRFPFHKYIFLAMCIERPTPELNSLLFKNDYIFVKNQRYDSFYVHKSIPNLEQIPKTPFSQVPPKNW